jgi:tetratricopeptide (TPR) repeat protein
MISQATAILHACVLVAFLCTYPFPFSGQGIPSEQHYAALLVEAKTLFTQQKFDESLRVLGECLALRRDDPEALKLVALNAIRLDKTATAEEALKSAGRLAPGDYLVHFNLGALYYTQSRFLDAEPSLQRAAELKPDYLPTVIFLALNLEELGQDGEAVKTYERAIALEAAQNAKNEIPYLYLGRLLYRLDRFAEAAPPLHHAVEIKPGSGEAWLMLGKTLKALGREDESIAALERAAAADAHSPEAHYLLNRAYLAQHREQDAQKELALFEALRTSESKKNDGRRKSQ